ncbi:cadherin-like beta sandwich domain-containing protein [Clostridium saccharoperbutylacetonicum]|uniref:cadherin-like beta sandwich domain-containing protein n=1 Tax=Clostridium saccharoperbutylacetonicum TaxID=36745 RepID=UPI0039E9A680
MGTKKFSVRKIIAYLLIFTVFFTVLQIGNTNKANAATQETTQVPGLVVHIGDLTENVTKIVDKDSIGGYICEYLPIGKGLTLTAASGYTITNVTSSSTSMVVGQVGNASGGQDYTIDSITDYSDFILAVTIKDSVGNSVTYPIKMRFEADSSLDFNILKVTLDSQTPTTFTYNQTDVNGNYSMKADATIKTAKIELLDSKGTPMTYTINGASSNSVDLVGGDNIIKIKRTNQNVSKQYTLVITKKGMPKLQTLIPSTGALTPAFDKDVNEYTLTVPTDQTTVSFIPTAVDNSSTIKVNGVSVASGSKSQNIKLSEGNNEVDIVLTTKDGDVGTYIVNVTRTPLFRSTGLTSLTLTSGTLSPAFNKGITEYTATVENSITSVGLTPTAEDPNATITVNGKNVPSAATSPNISLDEGVNTINVKVTDTKGNTQTYVVNVTRKYSKDNVNLATLSVTDGTLSPKFDPETYLYSVKVAKNIEKVRILFSAQNDSAKIKVNGKEYTNGQSDYIKLEVGANNVDVQVVAEDGTTTTTYKLSLIRGNIEGKNQWVLVAGEWRFYNAEGIQVKNDWVKYDNQWYFCDINGDKKTGWIFESGNWYYLNDDGIMITGWQYDKGYWYYLQGDGSMRTNVWATYDGKWYYFNNYGQLQTGWYFYKGKYYYMDDHGVMQKGWVTYDKNKYYLNDDGSMRTGWLYTGKIWYYLDDSGMMVRGWKNIGGKNYYFDANGVMKTGMFFLDGQWINLNNF